MSYNIDTWKQKACTLTVALDDLEDVYDVTYGRPSADGTTISVETGAEDGEIAGVLHGDVVTITSITHRATGSGHEFDTLKDFLATTRGTYEAVLVWEGGDSITRLRAVDGAVTNEEIDL